MTDREKAIVTAHTGITMLEGERFLIFHKYIEDIMERPVWTHELADKKVWEEIKERSRKDFIAICQSKDPIDRVLEIIDTEYWQVDEDIVEYHERLIKVIKALKGGEQE